MTSETGLSERAVMSPVPNTSTTTLTSAGVSFTTSNLSLSAQSADNATLDDECWYHSHLPSRSSAESLLLDKAEGCFLVRPSTTAKGDYVLSVHTNHQIVHYQIRSRGQSNPLFSLAEEPKVIHGLDELIHYYRHHPSNGLQHKLSSFIRGQRCPLETRLHGTDNLLHRSASAGNDRIVLELLEHNQRNILAKDSRGRNALHLAAINDHLMTSRLLLKHQQGSLAKRQSNAFDSDGKTPLHYACIQGNQELVKLLLEVGQADCTVRDQIRGWVPMHEASFNGHLNCIHQLIEHGAPIRPRTPLEETPLDLAISEGHDQVIGHLLALDNKNVGDESDQLDFESQIVHWNVDRACALSMLDQIEHEGNGEDGRFLIRRSSRKSTLVLSLRCQKRIFHFEILCQGLYLFLDQGPYMRSLRELLEHYSKFADGLPCPLQTPILSQKRKERRVRRAEVTQSLYSQSLCQVRGEWVTLQSDAAIGEGEFGSVYKGGYFDPVKGEQVCVAVKVLNSLEQKQQQAFLKEALVMIRLQHHCIVRLMGVCQSNPVMMLMELMPLGSLLSFLQLHPSSINVDVDIPLWASQVALGMHFMSEKGFVHRDLAARNILLASKAQAKISDFGLSRHLPEGKDYYRATNGGRWPVKWYAPECIKCSTFTSASDVWSFGVLLWEMYSLGQVPYGDLSGSESIAFVDEGQRLARPALAGVQAYAIMTWCWEHMPQKRPTFNELLKEFSNDAHEELNLIDQ